MRLSGIRWKVFAQKNAGIPGYFLKAFRTRENDL